MSILIRKRLTALIFALGILAFTLPGEAQISLGIRVGGPPPPPHVVIEVPWASPGYGAVWIQPHYEWVNGQWVWIHGYYEYPPRPDAVYIIGNHQYRHGDHYWVSSHWR